MRSNLLSLALIAGIGFGGAAFAASTDTTGVVKSIDEKTMTLTLEDGSAYVLPKCFDVKTLKVGEKVVVS